MVGSAPCTKGHTTAQPLAVESWFTDEEIEELKEMERVQGHTAGKWQSWDSTPSERKRGIGGQAVLLQVRGAVALKPLGKG